ncbi:unnamed protein product [Boreogadus saida]
MRPNRSHSGALPASNMNLGWNGINQFHLERSSMCPSEGLCHLLGKSSDICDEEWILNEQKELLSQAEAVKATFEVSNQLVHEVNMRRNISLSP